MDFVAEIIKEAAKYGLVPRIGARNDDKCTIVLLCKPPETQCCVSASLSGLEVLQNDEQVLDLIKGRVKTPIFQSKVCCLLLIQLSGDLTESGTKNISAVLAVTGSD